MIICKSLGLDYSIGLKISEDSTRVDVMNRIEKRESKRHKDAVQRILSLCRSAEKPLEHDYSHLSLLYINKAQQLLPMTSNDPQIDSEFYEDTLVHQVYEQIASHFSSTRYKPWPIVERFLKDLPDGSIGLDVGCGNGKYLAVNPNIFIIASDRSTNLAKIASQHRPHASIVADNLSLPHPRSAFDFTISIAVIHHLSTPARRIRAVAAVLETLRPSTRNIGQDNARQMSGGKALIYVWALEQRHSRRGWDEGDKQDVMVPWVMKQKPTTESTEESKTFNRYYHLYRQGELEHDIHEAGGLVLDSGYEKDNWWAIATRKPG